MSELCRHLPELLQRLALPLARLLLAMSVGLAAASLFEALQWTRVMARLAGPLVRAARLSGDAGVSFALAFFSPTASNAFLAEGHAAGKLSKREVVLSNLFNSSPTYLVHLPTLISLATAFLGKSAFIYVGLTFGAATLRTAGTVLAGRLLLPPVAAAQGRDIPADRTPWRLAAAKALARCKRRLFRLFLFTVPIYCAVFAMNKAGWFNLAEDWIVRHAAGLAFLPPEALGIMVLSLAAESGAAFSAASPLLQGGSLVVREVIMALLLGNILSSPVRAVRHQFPSYSGYYGPKLALLMVMVNQLCRVASLSIAAIVYWLIAF